MVALEIPGALGGTLRLHPANSNHYSLVGFTRGNAAQIFLPT